MYYHEVLTPRECRGTELDYLLSLGWYPMGQTIFTTSHLFRADDRDPKRVHWLRYPVSVVKERRSHRRIRRKNEAFQVELADPFKHSTELNNLYQKYLNSVDFDGYPNIADATYKAEGSNIYDSKAILIRDGLAIIACGIFYRGNSTATAILNFYDPDYRTFSPGKYLILNTLDYCRKEGIPWYYLGYVIQGDPKMDYKLFLGQQYAQYYCPDPSPLAGKWLPFRSELLT